ncbi:MAG TPA: hypothetical protein ENI61_03135 [Ignavibacteria bacterium]|nr:hypothetical protein [Ignavibacteria bacterium]
MKDNDDGSDIEIKYKSLSERRDQLKLDHGTVTAHLEARQKNLKKYMDECRGLGFDPDNLETEIIRLRNVIELKMSTFEAELEASEKIIKPMLDDVRRG